MMIPSQISPEGSDDVCGWPSHYKGSVVTFGDFSYVFKTRGQPHLRHSNLLLELEVATAARLGNQQQVGEQEQVSLLGLNALQHIILFVIEVILVRKYTSTNIAGNPFRELR
jgi:hypothetical protein